MSEKTTKLAAPVRDHADRVFNAGDGGCGLADRALPDETSLTDPEVNLEPFVKVIVDTAGAFANIPQRGPEAHESGGQVVWTCSPRMCYHSTDSPLNTWSSSRSTRLDLREKAACASKSIAATIYRCWVCDCAGCCEAGIDVCRLSHGSPTSGDRCAG